MEKFVQIYFDSYGFTFDSEPFALVIDYSVMVVLANLALALKVRKYLLNRRNRRELLEELESERDLNDWLINLEAQPFKWED